MKYLLNVWLALAVASAACTSSDHLTGPSLGDGGTTTVPASTETFNGTVPVGGSDIHTFNALAGPLTVTLNSAGPPATIVMGVGVGTPNGSACTIFNGGSVNTSAGSSAQLTGSINSPGPLCVQVSDIGNQTASVTYRVTVIHS